MSSDPSELGPLGKSLRTQPGTVEEELMRMNGELRELRDSVSKLQRTFDNPSRTIARGVFFGVAFVALLYVAFNLFGHVLISLFTENLPPPSV